MKSLFTFLPVLIFSFRSNAQSITFSLASGSPVSSSSFMRCLLSKDLNNDGNKDLLVGNAYGNNINVFNGNGAGQFLSTGSYSLAGNGPIYMTLADFNADAKPDVAIANYNANNISVMLKTTSGPFTTAANSPYTIGNQPYSLDVADFNMDGKMDIVACSANGYNVNIWPGNGLGSFSATPSFSISTPPVPYHVCAGFFNQDMFPDFAFVSASGNQLYVYLNTGTGSFSASAGSPYTTGSEPRTISSKDLNNDGYTDLVVPNALSNNLYVYMGSASGTFTSASGSPISVGSYPYQVGIADFDFNGTQDLVVACAGSNALYRLSGNGNGTFASGGSPIAVGSMPQSLVTDDFNNDGKPDVAIADWLGSDINVFLNTATLCPVSSGFSFTTQTNGQVDFASSSTGTTSGTNYSWNFGNGNTAQGSSASQTFTTGVYTVTLTVSNSSLCSSTSTQIVSVCLLAPGFTYSVLSGGQVSFNDTSTGTGVGSFYTWNFGDNSISNGNAPLHTYVNGTYTVTLLISSSSMCAATASQVLTVCALSPSFTYSLQPNGQVVFNNTTAAPLSTTSYSWNFGDNSSGSGSPVNHSYANGTYTVTLFVTDFPGCRASVSQVVSIDPTTGLTEVGVSTGIRLFPNPANDCLTIEFRNNSDLNQTELVLYSLTGSEVLHVDVQTNSTSVSVDQLPPGLYHFKIRAGSKLLKTGSIAVYKH